jgi:hypothetical protein
MSSKDLIAAPAKAVILSLLLSGESYGYQIIKRVRRPPGFGGTLEWSHAIAGYGLSGGDDDRIRS